jgi:hypothetical protein
MYAYERSFLRYPNEFLYCLWFCFTFQRGIIFSARGSVIGSGIMLHAGRLRVPFPIRLLEFSVVLILAVVLWPWSRLRI